MSRRLRSSLLMTGTMLEPNVPEGVRAMRQKKIYDKTANTLPDLTPDDVVRYQKGKIVEAC